MPTGSAGGSTPFAPANHPRASRPGRQRAPAYDRVVVLRVDRVTDLNAQNDDGRGWSSLTEVADPTAFPRGAALMAGNRHARAAVRIVSVDADGQLHFEIL